MKQQIRLKKRQLEQDLEMPGINVVLVAHFTAANRSRWYVRFFLPGYDGRFNPGLAVVSSSKMPILVKALKNAHKKMQQLEQELYPGAFSEDFISNGEVSDNLAVTISSVKRSHFFFWHYTQATAYFLVSSETNTFLASFGVDELKSVINSLSSAENTAGDLIKLLKK